MGIQLLLGVPIPNMSLFELVNEIAGCFAVAQFFFCLFFIDWNFSVHLVNLNK